MTVMNESLMAKIRVQLRKLIRLIIAPIVAIEYMSTRTIRVDQVSKFKGRIFFYLENIFNKIKNILFSISNIEA